MARLRISNAFDNKRQVKYKELNAWLTEHKVFGLVVTVKENVLEYKYWHMKHNRDLAPEELLVTVSIVSKLIIGAAIRDHKFASVDELKEYYQY